MSVETGQVALGDRSVVGDRCVFPFRKLTNHGTGAVVFNQALTPDTWEKFGKVSPKIRTVPRHTPL
jgi:hypothetical protein